MLDPRVPEPRACVAPARCAAAQPSRTGDRGDRVRRAADRSRPANGRACRGAGTADIRRIRALADSRRRAGPRLLARDAPASALGRLGLPRASYDRRSHPAPSREARDRPARARVHLHRSRRRVPIQGLMSAFRTVGARLSLALLGVVALVLGLVYFLAVPSLKNRLIDTRLHDLAIAAPKVMREYKNNPDDPDFFSNAAATTNARVLLLTVLAQSPTSVTVQQWSLPGRSARDFPNDPVAIHSAQTGKRQRGTVTRSEGEFAEVAQPVGTNGDLLLLAAPLREAFADVHAVQRRLRRARPAVSRLRPHAHSPRRPRSREAGIRRERLARAPDAALLAERFSGVDRGRRARRGHAAGIPGDHGRAGAATDEARRRSPRPLAVGCGSLARRNAAARPRSACRRGSRRVRGGCA